MIYDYTGSSDAAKWIEQNVPEFGIFNHSVYVENHRTFSVKGVYKAQVMTDHLQAGYLSSKPSRVYRSFMYIGES